MDETRRQTPSRSMIFIEECQIRRSRTSHAVIRVFAAILRSSTGDARLEPPNLEVPTRSLHHRLSASPARPSTIGRVL
jgi:hypothetical protein